MLGPDYAGFGADELVASGPHEPRPAYLADLFVKRLVTLAETREGGRVNETLIKKLTSSEATWSNWAGARRGSSSPGPIGAGPSPRWSASFGTSNSS